MIVYVLQERLEHSASKREKTIVYLIKGVVSNKSTAEKWESIDGDHLYVRKSLDDISLLNAISKLKISKEQD